MKNSVKITLAVLAVAVLSAGVSYVTVSNVFKAQQVSGSADSSYQQAVRYVNLQDRSGVETDFTLAAEQSVHAVVHITSKSMRTTSQPMDIFEYFFGYRGQAPQQQQPQVGYGSGVIITPDGYIITNNHVIDGADEIAVTLNDKTEYSAKVIGTDPNTDLALIKVEAKDLPSIPFGNSDELKIGEWVLAVGNPMNLTSTVTAGIVSAKARNLGIIGSNRRRSPNQPNLSIESFIQTDAAVNPGNSGGALVNLNGELVGINTAIMSQTGSFTGYSFAVPVNIVARVIGDIKEFGSFQRPFLGVSIRNIDANLSKEKNIPVQDGVYVDAVEDMGAAMEAGIKAGDIILEIEDVRVNESAQLQEQVSRYRPGDKIEVKVKRDSKTRTFDVTLRNRQGGTDTLKNQGTEVLGAAFSPLADDQKRQLNISYGVQVSGLTDGKCKDAGIRKGFIILKINDQRVNSAEDIEAIVKQVQTGSGVVDRGLFIVGMYPNGKVSYYAIDLNA
ncbi:MAG: Do family serine endopeptidase [Bacteroidales bacterium]|nr:Do family serine endopeptidase [Bacteroidales bacterium]